MTDDLDEKMKSIIANWEAEDPGSTDVDSPPGQRPGVQTMPEMDLSSDGPDAEPDSDADDFSAGASSLAREATQAPLRLRAPSDVPATAGAGQKGVSSSAGFGSPETFHAKPVASLSDDAPPDWKSIGNRLGIGTLSQAQSKNYESMLANAGNSGAYVQNQHAGEVGPAMVKGELDVMHAKQGQESHDLDMQGKKAALGVKSAMDDPNSLQSQKARDAIKAFFGDMTLPRNFDNWSANDVQKFASSGTLAHVAQVKNAQADDARKVADKQAKDTQTAADLEASRTAFAKELKEIGVDPTKASQKDIDRVISLKHAAATEHVAGSNLAIAQSNRHDKDEDRATLKETIPFGSGELHYTGKGTPREEDRKKAQDIASGWNAALSGMSDLEGSLKGFATNPGVDSKRDVESKVRVVSAALNSAVGGGAMSEAEALAMAKALGADVVSPSGIQAALEHLIGDDPKAAQVLLTRLNSVRQSAKATAAGKLKSYRYELGGEAGGGAIKMKFPDGSVHDVSPDKLEKAKMKGGVPVDG